MFPTRGIHPSRENMHTVEEFPKGADNGVADALSQVPICHNHETVQSLMEGAIVGATD